MEQQLLNKSFKAVMVSAAALVLASFIFSIYYNIKLNDQIEERNRVIDDLTYHNNMMSRVIHFNTDSVGGVYYVFLKSDSNKIYTYEQLANIVENQSKVIQKQDAVILAAKRRYKFDYSVKFTNDSILVVTWNKP